MRRFLQNMAAATAAAAAAALTLMLPPFNLRAILLELASPKVHVLIAYAMLVSGGVCKQLFQKSA